MLWGTWVAVRVSVCIFAMFFGGSGRVGSTTFLLPSTLSFKYLKIVFEIYFKFIKKLVRITNIFKLINFIFFLFETNKFYFS